jgi:putative FmdB family regulatory protein
MPIYEYECLECHKVFEERRNVGDHTEHCPECGGLVRHKFGAFTFRFRPRNWRPYSPEDSAHPATLGEETCVG